MLSNSYGLLTMMCLLNSRERKIMMQPFSYNFPWMPYVPWILSGKLAELFVSALHES